MCVAVIVGESPDDPALQPYLLHVSDLKGLLRRLQSKIEVRVIYYARSTKTGDV